MKEGEEKRVMESRGLGLSGALGQEAGTSRASRGVPGCEPRVVPRTPLLPPCLGSQVPTYVLARATWRFVGTMGAHSVGHRVRVFILSVLDGPTKGL